MDGTCTREAGRWIASDILGEIMEMSLTLRANTDSTPELITAPVGTHHNLKKAIDGVSRASKDIWMNAIRTAM